MALSAAKAALPGEHDLTQVSFLQALVLANDQPRPVQIVLTPQLLARYRAAIEALGHDVQRAASEVGARCLQVDLSIPFDDVVMRVFRAGGFLG